MIAGDYNFQERRVSTLSSGVAVILLEASGYSKGFEDPELGNTVAFYNTKRTYIRACIMLSTLHGLPTLEKGTQDTGHVCKDLCLPHPKKSLTVFDILVNNANA